MKIDEIVEITGKTREEVKDMLDKQDLIEIKLTEREAR
jgi:uncharacterized protein YvpB